MNEFIKNCRQISLNYSKVRFKQFEKAKLNKKVFRSDVEGSYICGIVGFCEYLLRNEKDGQYKSYDEVIGDIQCILKESIELFYSDYCLVRYKNKKVNIEDIIEKGFTLD